jgi:amino acid transporter
MGRDRAIPERFFASVDSKHHIPRNNVLLTGAIILLGSQLLSYQLGAELLNFGAFIAFMGVNLAAFVQFFLRNNRREAINFFPPVIGFLVCSGLWLSLRPTAKLAGFAWLLIGLAYGAWRTGGFRSRSLKFELPSE